MGIKVNSEKENKTWNHVKLNKIHVISVAGVTLCKIRLTGRVFNVLCRCWGAIAWFR